MEQKILKIKIVNKLGLHARASASFVKEASKFDSEIFVLKGENKVNGKSIMGLMMLAAAKGTTIAVTTKGNQAKEAIDALTILINSKFGED